MKHVFLVAASCLALVACGGSSNDAATTASKAKSPEQAVRTACENFAADLEGADTPDREQKKSCSCLAKSMQEDLSERDMEALVTIIDEQGIGSLIRTQEQMNALGDLGLTEFDETSPEGRVMRAFGSVFEKCS
ncbi:MAG: hypothetical protein AAFY84_11075 [Pseudomonadota bacterium]